MHLYIVYFDHTIKCLIKNVQRVGIGIVAFEDEMSRVMWVDHSEAIHFGNKKKRIKRCLMSNVLSPLHTISRAEEGL